MITRFAVPSCPLPSRSVPCGPPGSKQKGRGREQEDASGSSAPPGHTSPGRTLPGQSPPARGAWAPRWLIGRFQSGQSAFLYYSASPTKGLAPVLTLQRPEEVRPFEGSPHPPCLLGVPALVCLSASDVRHQRRSLAPVPGASSGTSATSACSSVLSFSSFLFFFFFISSDHRL